MADWTSGRVTGKLFKTRSSKTRSGIERAVRTGELFGKRLLARKRKPEVIDQ